MNGRLPNVIPYCMLTYCRPHHECNDNCNAHVCRKTISFAGMLYDLTHMSYSQELIDYFPELATQIEQDIYNMIIKEHEELKHYHTFGSDCGESGSMDQIPFSSGSYSVR